MNDQITITNTDQGQCLSVAGNNYRVIVPGEQTGGEYAIIDMLVPPGGGPGPHSHTDINESFYVVDGEVEFKTEAGKQIAKKGAFINIPEGGAVHCFKNTSTEMARLLCTVMPAGLDDFFRAVGTEVEPGVFLPPPALDEAAIADLKVLAEKYGQKLYPPNYLG